MTDPWVRFDVWGQRAYEHGLYACAVADASDEKREAHQWLAELCRDLAITTTPPDDEPDHDDETLAATT